MIRNSRRARQLRGLAVIAAAALIPAIAGCEAGANAPTQRWHQPTPGASATLNDGAISLRNVFVLGAPIASSLQPGTSAGLFMAVANTGSADRLVSITAPGSAASVTLPGSGVRVGKNQAVFLTGPLPKVVLHGLTHSLAGGTSIRVTMDFQNAGSVTLQVPVMPRAQYYATLSPPPSPTPSATPAPAHASATPTPTPTQ